MKKVISLIIVLAVALSVCAFAAADDMTISYTTGQAYEIVIPASTSFSANKLSFSDKVSLKNVLLGIGKQVNVTMKSANDFNLKFENSAIPYMVSDDNGALGNEAVVLSVLAGSTSGEATLSFATTANDIAKATLAGEHTDTLSFTVAVNTIDPPYQG